MVKKKATRITNAERTRENGCIGKKPLEMNFHTMTIKGIQNNTEDSYMGIAALKIKQDTAKEVWGIASAIDIYHCDPEKIRNADYIKQFVIDLCDLIEMKRFGETQVVHFGEDEKVAGFSMVQLIETSLISAHFANLSNATYLDVFSCKAYDPEVVKQFSQDYFSGTFSSLNVTYRR